MNLSNPIGSRNFHMHIFFDVDKNSSGVCSIADNTFEEVIPKDLSNKINLFFYC